MGHRHDAPNRLWILAWIASSMTISLVATSDQGLKLNGEAYIRQNYSEIGHSAAHGVKVASLKLDYVKAEIILTVFIVLIGLFKLRMCFLY